jgi:UbiD family decarboxylase
MIARRPQRIVRPATINVASLRSTIDDLRAAGTLVETDVEVDPNLEFAGIQKRMDGGPPVQFNRVKGYPHARLVMNLFSQREMIDRLFGFTSSKDRTQRVAEMIRKPLPPVIVERAEAPAQEVVVTEDLRVLDLIVPIRHTLEEEEATVGSGVTLLTGRFFGGGNHVGYNRQNYRWPDAATFQVAPGGHMWMASTQAYGKERIPLTINFGIPPAATLAAGAGFDYVVLPYGCDELGVAGAMQGAPIELVPAVSIPDAFSIAQAEYVIEGYLDPTERKYETKRSEETQQQGEHPFHPEWAGYMGKAYRAPVFHVTAITHRRLESRPIIQPMIVHGSEENNIQTTVREAALYELADRIMPGFTEDVNIPFAMTDWGGAIFQVNKRNAVDEGYQRNIMVAAMASSRGMRMAIAVDTDIDIYSMDDIMWALTTRVNPQTDFLNPVPGGAGQTFQPSERMTAGASERKASNTRFEGGIAIDATFPYGQAQQFARPKYPIERVELERWFSADVIAKAAGAQEGWLKLLARTGQ